MPIKPSPLVVRDRKRPAPPPISSFFAKKIIKPSPDVPNKPLPKSASNPAQLAVQKKSVPVEGPKAVGLVHQYTGPDAQPSEQDDPSTVYVRRLVNGTDNFQGIMRAKNRMGDVNRPYAHQRIAVKQIASKKITFYVLAHDMGTGKTATILQAIAAEGVMRSRMPKALISAPASTLQQWKDSILDWLRIPESRILVTNELKRVTAEVMRNKDIVVVSRDLVANAFASFMKKYSQHHQVDTPYGQRWVSSWDRKGFDGAEPIKPVHPLFELEWDMLAIDECHYLRNSDSRWCEAHHSMSLNSKKVVMASGTIVVNKTDDLAGICKGGNCPTDTLNFQNPKVWCNGRDKRTVNRTTVYEFQKRFVNVAKDTILSLPPLVQEVVDYNVDMPLDCIDEYNSVLADAQNLRLRIERSGSATGKDLQRLMSLLQVMQQLVVHPLLAEMSAARFKSETALFDQAAAAPTGAMWALKAELESLRAQGHKRIAVACCHTSLLEIAKRFLAKSPELGVIDTFSGDLSTKQRQTVKERFLKSTNSVLMLSIGAGGVGLHLVPGCEAMLLWGSMAFSPAHTRQVIKRIHRLGQTAPLTGKVSIKHLVPYGSVDAAIGKLHCDKSRLIALVQDGDDTGFSRPEDATWRKYGRIVDECHRLAADGRFPSMPIFDPSDQSGTYGYTILQGIQTRGRGVPKPIDEKPSDETAESKEAKRQQNVLFALSPLSPMPPPGQFDPFGTEIASMAIKYRVPLEMLMAARPTNTAVQASAAASLALAL